MTKNLGLGGLFLLEAPPWPIDTVVPLKIVHGALEADARGRVARHESDGVGLAFVEPSPQVRAILEEIIVDLVAVDSSFDEQRGEPRHRTEVTVTWRHGAVAETSSMGNLGFKGAFVHASSPPPVGSLCYLYLPAVTGERVRQTELCGCEVRVMHTSDDGFGVQFDKPSEEFRAAVAHLVQRIAAESPNV